MKLETKTAKRYDKPIRETLSNAKRYDDAKKQEATHRDILANDGR